MNLPPHKHRTPSPTNSLMTKLLAWVLGYTSTQPHIVTTPRTKLATWPRTVRLRKNFQIFFFLRWRITHTCLAFTGTAKRGTLGRKRRGEKEKKRKANPPVEKRESLDRLVLLSMQPQLVCAPNYYTTLTTRSTDGYGGLPIKYAITYLAAANANPPLRTPATPIFVVLVTHRVLPPPNHSTKLFPMIFYGSHTCVRNPWLLLICQL